MYRHINRHAYMYMSLLSTLLAGNICLLYIKLMTLCIKALYRILNVYKLYTAIIQSNTLIRNSCQHRILPFKMSINS